MSVKNKNTNYYCLISFALIFFAGAPASLASQVKDPGPLLSPSPSAKAWQHTREQFDKCKFNFVGALAAADGPQEIRATRNLVNNVCSCVVNKMADFWEAYGRDNMPTLLRLMRNGGEDIDKISDSCNSKYAKPYIKTNSSSSGPSPAQATPASPKSALILVPVTAPANRYPLDCNKQPSKSLFQMCMQNI